MFFFSKQFATLTGDFGSGRGNNLSKRAVWETSLSKKQSRLEGPIQNTSLTGISGQAVPENPKKQPKREHRMPDGQVQFQEFLIREAPCCQVTHARPDIIWSAYRIIAGTIEPQKNCKNLGFGMK